MAEKTPYMLDTNTASFIIRGAGQALKDKLRSVPMASLCISAVTRGELLYGLARKPDASALRAAVHAFLLRVEALPWDAEVADHYGVLRAALEAQGAPMGSLDMMIAAHAIARGCTLVTSDQAFRRIDGLIVEDWAAA
jgi:tRNA(fMet)-specific endonuclease VapC